MKAQELYSKLFISAIEKTSDKIDNPIYVLYGDMSILNLDQYEGWIIDKETFASTGGEEVFTKDWFARLFISLQTSTTACILSYAQYSYFIHQLSKDFFKSRVIVIKDNLRRVFPLQASTYITDTQEDDNNVTEIPVYQVDQFKSGDSHYYIAKTPEDDLGKYSLNAFTGTLDLQICGVIPPGGELLDPFADDNEIDILLDQIISGKEKTPAFYIKLYEKQPQERRIKELLLHLNAFLHPLKKSIMLVIEESLTEDFTPSDELTDLLQEYWGAGATFRPITLYKNPSLSAETINISQGKVVQTVIDEYENVRAGRTFRDIFLTAPTGAGKSLLFQLPAFYISKKGDVTIVISPLIALMKDQVNAIHTQRGFNKAAYLNSEISLLDRDRIIEQCQGGEIDVLYMAPELLMSYDIRHFIGDRRIGLMVIDEAHLITTWGRDFRVDYWYLGSKIRKIRKYSEHSFPMIAVTATAVYGGEKNDMVFDTAEESLMMHSPHYFIGRVKRDDIEFVISNYTSKAKDFDKHKLEQTSKTVSEINKLGFKTLVYAPYTNHVLKLSSLINQDEEISVSYYGTLDALSKEQSEKQFRANDKNVMVCTKAFGMGVDIPDIQVVYHHAPSGLLPDYIQEIGRAARKTNIKGYATLNYSERDQTYSKRLYGMSALRLWQIKAVLKKIHDTYQNNGHKRNMLLSVDDFAFAFENDGDDIDQKVKTALMMIEKDYLIKYQFNVVIARPKQLFTKVYSKVSASDLKTMVKKYPETFEVLFTDSDGSKVILLDLNELWTRYFNDRPFPQIKKRYFEKTLLSDCYLSPRYKLTYVFEDKDKTISAINDFFDTLSLFLSDTCGCVFDKDNLRAALKKKYDDKTAKQLANFVLSTYSDDKKSHFLQEKSGVPKQYKVSINSYGASFSDSMKKLGELINANDTNKVVRYKSKDDSVPFVRIGHLIEILDLGSFEMRGGDNPMIFIRVNSPERVRKDCFNKSYENILYDKTKDKHEISSELMNHFFTRHFSNEERWNFIEDFFLGSSLDELVCKYPGKDPKSIDLLDELSKKPVQKMDINEHADVAHGKMTYPPRSGTYTFKDHLTIGEETRTIKGWVDEDSLTLYDLVKDHTVYLDAVVYTRLMGAIEKDHPDFYVKLLALRKMIQIPGYKEPTMAEVVMKENPIKFYKWWCAHREEVYIPTKDKIWLFDFVERKEKGLLKKQDKTYIDKLTKK